VLAARHAELALRGDTRHRGWPCFSRGQRGTRAAIDSSAGARHAAAHEGALLNHRLWIRAASILALGLGGSGCLMMRGGDMPEAPKAQPTAAPMPLSYQVHFKAFGEPNARVNLDATVGEELRSSPAFRQVVMGTGTPTHVDITVDDEGSRAVAIITGVFSGLTLTVLPGYARDNYTMTAIVTKNGAEVKRYTYDDHVTLVMELFLVFGMPFVDGKDSMPLVFRNMTRQLVVDMQKDGLTSG
jgi:hypothetical protein